MGGTWQPLVNQPGFNTSTMILLTDGRVMVQEEAQAHWHALTPDSNGSYVNGTWSTLADMSFWRRYYASGVLKDGRVIVIGGEQSGGGGDTNKGEIYDPVSDSWSPIPTPPWAIVGDAASCILPDGRLMIGALVTPDCILYDPVTNSWSPAASKAVRSNEESWVLLPDDTIVTTQCWDPYKSEKYIISANTWKSEGPIPARVVDPVMHEMGPGMLMYNGKVIFFGAANEHGRGKTIVYTPPAFPAGTGTWAIGPDIPPAGRKANVSNDCPATLMPNGKVLFTAANFVNNGWGSPVLFFEYDPPSNTIAAAPTPPNNATFPYPQFPAIYWSRMMLLPTGQVLFSASSPNVQCYTPDPGPQEAWRPTISRRRAALLARLLPVEGDAVERALPGEHVRRRLLAGDELPGRPAARLLHREGLLLPFLQFQHDGGGDRRFAAIVPVHGAGRSVRRIRPLRGRQRHQLSLRELLSPQAGQSLLPRHEEARLLLPRRPVRGRPSGARSRRRRAERGGQAPAEQRQQAVERDERRGGRRGGQGNPRRRGQGEEEKETVATKRRICSRASDAGGAGPSPPGSPCRGAYFFTGPRYLSSQSRLSRMNSLRGTAWPVS